jgi:hypothetical protein
MNSQKLFAMAAISALGLSFLAVGCSHTLSKTEETRVSSDGSIKSKEKTVTQNPDGSVTTTESRKTSSP